MQLQEQSALTLTVSSYPIFMFTKHVNILQPTIIPSICHYSDDLHGSKLLATITQSSSSNKELNGEYHPNIGPFCLDKLAITDVESSLYCRTKQELFPWIKLEYQEEVIS